MNIFEFEFCVPDIFALILCLKHVYQLRESGRITEYEEESRRHITRRGYL
jgi:hypothetical protein